MSLSATLRKMHSRPGHEVQIRAGIVPVPCRVATSGSVAGWDVPLLSGERAVSTISTPASIALSRVISPVPEVLCVQVDGDFHVLLGGA